MSVSIKKKTTSNDNVGRKARSFLMLIHHVLLASHITLVVWHSLKTGIFGFEFWATLIVNLLLLLDLEGLADKFTRHNPSFVC